MSVDFKNVTLLYHADSGSGMGGKVAPQVADALRSIYPNGELEVIKTESKEHIAELGRTSKADLIAVLSGDGSLHDLIQTIVERPADERPTIVPIPAGSGNDFVRTLDFPLDPLKTVEILPQCVVVKSDVVRVKTEVESVYSLETLSFGVDAAVSLNTQELRLKTKTRGLLLYGQAAVLAILREFDAHRVKIKMEGNEFEIDLLFMAAQNGPTYGSGFNVCPDASIVDGMIDINIVAGISKFAGLMMLPKLQKGTHRGRKGVTTYRSPWLELEFTEQLPVQCDGERVLGLKYFIDIIPGALEVLALPSAKACK